MTEREPTEENTRPTSTSKLVTEPVIDAVKTTDLQAGGKALLEQATKLRSDIDAYAEKFAGMDVVDHAKVAAARASTQVTVTWFENLLGLKKAA